ncbi:MAG: hypothetical protein C5B52_07315 [Bacteroidetes bacterium]|nr:MAG: hypothetical protein C5B52_07315 [Bacteroidota bacterium]
MVILLRVAIFFISAQKAIPHKISNCFFKFCCKHEVAKILLIYDTKPRDLNRLQSLFYSFSVYNEWTFIFCFKNTLLKVKGY